MFTGLRYAGIADMGCSSMNISPSLGVSRPASMRSNVVLPQPDGPSSEKNSPRWISRSTLSTACTAPKCFETPQIEMMPRSFMLTNPPGSLAGLGAAPADPFRDPDENGGTIGIRPRIRPRDHFARTEPIVGLASPVTRAIQYTPPPQLHL